jgi:hypothetical protein
MEPTDLHGVLRMGRFDRRAEAAMRTRRIEQTALTTIVIAACALFFVAAYAAIAHAQNPSSSLTIPQQPEVPVSPTTPGTLPGTGAGPGTAVGTNPITGQPCAGGGASALNGGMIGAPTTPDQPGEPGQDASGLPPNNSIYGLGTTTNFGAC